LPSAVSGSHACQAAHTGGDGGTGQKSSDYTCIPLTWPEHLEYHLVGRAQFERLHGIDCAQLVRALKHAWFAHSAGVK